MSLDIIVDVDEVLRDTMTEIIRIYNTYYNVGKEVNHSNIKSWDLFESMPELSKHYNITEPFFRNYSIPIFKESKQIEGSLDGMNKIKDMGHNIHIASSQYKGLEHLTGEWLNINGYPYDSLHFTFNKGVLKGDYMIDDNIHNFNGFGGKGLLFTRNFNKHLDVERVRDWSHVLEVLGNYDGRQRENYKVIR